MEKFITYSEKEIKERLSYIRYKLSDIKQSANWMTEQHEGKRSNISMSEGYDILKNIDDIEEIVKDFKLLLPEE